jgi:hypothetical protein
MKKIYTTIIVVFTCSVSNAQINAGQILIGGSLGYQHNSIKSDGQKYRLSEISLSPSVGIFVIDKLAAGFRISFDGYSYHNPEVSINHYKKRATSFSPFGRYYFLNKDKIYNFFFDMSFDLYKLKMQYDDRNPFEYDGSGYSFSGGPVFFLSRHVALEFAFGYTRQYDLDIDKLTRIFTSLGFQYHLANRRSK